MGAHKRTDTALNTQIFIPDRSRNRNIALFDTGGSRGEGTVSRHGRKGQLVAQTVNDRTKGSLDRLRTAIPFANLHFNPAVGGGGHTDFFNILKGGINRLLVHIDHLVTRLAVRLDNGTLDFSNGLIQGNNIGNLEEGGLHNDVDARPQAKLFTQSHPVDNIELQLFVNNLLLHIFRQIRPDIVFAKGRVQQEGCTLFGIFEHVVLFQERKVMTGNKVGFLF